MSCFISELQIPEDSGGLFWSACQHCRRREDCPYAHVQRQGTEAARFLTEEAGRFLEAVSHAGTTRCLLDAGEALERALERTLCTEISLICDIRTKAAETSP